MKCNLICKLFTRNIYLHKFTYVGKWKQMKIGHIFDPFVSKNRGTYKMPKVIEINFTMIFMEWDLQRKMYISSLPTLSNLPVIFVINIF